MGHLNYFFPYNKGTDYHEDHLTRAFLVLLKYSNSALASFYSYVQAQLNAEQIYSLKPLYKQQLTDIDYETQVGYMPVVNMYISILITNETRIITQNIEAKERTAIYDGVINFNDEFVFFIETKPNKDNVWEDQLCPAKKDIPEDAELLKRPAVLEWKEIINFLHRVNESTTTPPHEKLLINDFFELVSTNFDYLNPFNDLSKCHSVYLANRRIEQILKDIAVDPNKVKYHSGWGYYIELDLPEIRKIGLLLSINSDGDWTDLCIGVDFGSTVSQARAFYQNIKSPQVFNALSEWDIYCNFHLSYQSKALVHFKSPDGSFEKYIQYWQQDVYGNFGGVLKEELESSFLEEYVAEGILIYDAEKKEEVRGTIMEPRYPRINICPAIGMEYYISKDDAVKLDRNSMLISEVAKRMKEVLGILSHSLVETLK
jgi:hypothetical protein